MAELTEEMHPRIPNKPSTTPYWRTQPSALDDFRLSEIPPVIVDVAIIGTGISGACVAYHLLADERTSATSSIPSIAIFEAREACSGATGRNGGHTKLSPRAIAAFASKYGPAAGLDLALMIHEVMQQMKACAEAVVVSDNKTDEYQDHGPSRTLEEECEMLVTRSWDVFLDENHAANIEKVWNETVRDMKEVARKEAREHDLDWLQSIQFLKGENVEKITSIRDAKAATSCPAISLWPYKFVLGLLQHVVNLGAQLYTHTPVTRIERVSGKAGSRPHELGTRGVKALHTPRGTTLARKVVFSTNAYVSALLSQYEKTIIPGRGTACRIVRQPLASSSTAEYSQLINTYNIHRSSTSVEYFVPRPDGSVVLGGGQSLYRSDKSVWYDMIDDGTLIDIVRERLFEGYMGRHFRGWDIDGKDEKIDCVWTGIMGYTEDSWPHVGLVPGETDHFILAGFNGAGMASIFIVARGIARMVRDGISFEDTGLPKVFKSVPERIKAKLTRWDA